MNAPFRSMQLRRWMRPWTFGIGMFAFISAFGIHTRPIAYSTPVFASVRSIMPLEAWALLWTAVGILNFAAAITRRVLPWRIGGPAAIGAALVWLGGVSWAHWVDGAPLSLTGWGLWAWFVYANVLGLLSNRQFERRPERSEGVSREGR